MWIVAGGPFNQTVPCGDPASTTPATGSPAGVVVQVTAVGGSGGRVKGGALGWAVAGDIFSTGSFPL